MDSYAGDPQTPISLHKYAYANLDPALMVDPSGRFADLGSTMRGIAGRAAMGFKSLSVRNAKSYLKAAIKSAREAAKRMFKSCARSRSRKCDVDLPIIYLGLDAALQTKHVFEAIMDGKSHLLNRYFPKHPDNYKPGYPWNPWRLQTLRGECPRPNIGMECDEYPYASSWKGGLDNYILGRVSLKAIPKAQINKLAKC
jgi:hypothetical protein